MCHLKGGDCAPLGDTPPPQPLLFAGAGVLDLSSLAWVILSQGYMFSEFQVFVYKLNHPVRFEIQKAFVYPHHGSTPGLLCGLRQTTLPRGLQDLSICSLPLSDEGRFFYLQAGVIAGSSWEGRSGLQSSPS